MSTSESQHVTESPWTVHHLPGDIPELPAGTLEARLLGEASSRRDGHNHPTATVPPGQRCSACRWFTVAIYRVADDPAEYLIYTAGWSVVPGERTLPKIQRTSSAFDVLELMTVRNSKDGTFIPKANARALAQAAAHDAAIQDAYVNRVTV